MTTPAHPEDRNETARIEAVKLRAPQRPGDRAMTYRTGRTLGRTIYRQVGDEPSKDDVFIGVMDTRELGQLVVDALNATMPARPFSALKPATRAWLEDARRAAAGTFPDVYVDPTLIDGERSQ